MQLRHFNDAGVAAFRTWLEQLRHDPTLAPPHALLDDPDTSAPLDPPIIAAPATFANRMEFALWLDEAARVADTRIPLPDAGFWAWLTLLLFDQVCPVADNGRSAGVDARYIPDSDYRRRYRHLLATAYGIYYMHHDDPSRVQFLLHVPLHVFGELTEQFAARQELISCPGTMSLANYLFFDTPKGTLKASSGGKSARRLGKLLGQYMRTWDITVMAPADSAGLLPREFDRFKPAGEAEKSG